MLPHPFTNFETKMYFENEKNSIASLVETIYLKNKGWGINFKSSWYLEIGIYWTAFQKHN